MNAQAAEWELTDEENAKIEAAYAKIFESEQAWQKNPFLGFFSAIC